MNSLSVVIPAYNEGSRIAPSLLAIERFLSRMPFRWEILVVNDGSRDDTVEQVKALTLSIPQLRILNHEVNQGKGAAVRTGLLSAQGEAILFCDADGATPIDELGKLLPHLENGADFITGSRRVKGSLVFQRQSFKRRFMSDVYQLLCRWMLRPKVRDLTCGFKLLSRKSSKLIAPRMRINRWSFDAEMYTIARIHRLKVVEVPIRWCDQRKTKVHLLRDAQGSFLELLKILRFSIQGAYR